MKWENFAAKLPLAVYAALIAAAFAVVMHDGVTVAQSVKAGIGITAEPLNAAAATAVMAAIGIHVFMRRRTHGE